MSHFSPIDVERAGNYEKLFRRGHISHPLVDAIRGLEPGECHAFREKELTPPVHDMLCAARVVYGWHSYEFERSDYNMTINVKRPPSVSHK